MRDTLHYPMKTPYTTEQSARLQELLLILKKTSTIYKKANNSQRIKLFDMSLKYVDELVDTFGWYRDFSESLLMFGSEFLSVPSMMHNPLYRSLFPEAYKIFNL
jgi:hypothetical protein